MAREVKENWIPMLEELKKRSNGRITYTMYAGAALGTHQEHYDIVKNGLSDMGYFTSTFTPGRFPLTDVLSLPVNLDDKAESTDIANAMYKRILHSEFKGVKMMSLNSCLTSYLWTKKPVHTLEDLKGLRIRAPGGHQANAVKGLGAAVVFFPLPDVYLALETGTIDGLVTDVPLFLTFKLYEQAKFGALASFGCVSEGLIMNSNSWKKTPEDLKPIIEEVCSNSFRITHSFTAEDYKKWEKLIADKGVELYSLPPSEKKRWYTKFQQNTRDWVEKLEKKGLPAKETTILFNEEATKRGYDVVSFPPEWKE
jgi:TRAP-type C4-dicarboxylate transport system substrate-binding protein